METEWMETEWKPNKNWMKTDGKLNNNGIKIKWKTVWNWIETKAKMNENCMTLSENWVKMSNRAHKATVSAPNGKSCEESDHRARVMWRRRIGNELAKRIMAHKANGGGGLVKEANLRFKPTAPSAKNSCGKRMRWVRYQGVRNWMNWTVRSLPNAYM